jgi:hypothetical protein
MVVVAIPAFGLDAVFGAIFFEFLARFLILSFLSYLAASFEDYRHVFSYATARRYRDTSIATTWAIPTWCFSFRPTAASLRHPSLATIGQGSRMDIQALAPVPQISP